MTLFLRDDLAAVWPEADAFERARTQDGEVFRAREGRRTLRFAANGKSYFLKYHAGIGWREILKNLLQGKLPVTSAMNEVRAIEAVTAAGIATMTLAGYGERGNNPARIESFIVTDDLVGTLSLEELVILWQAQPPAPAFRRALVTALAEATRAMHGAGVNHRDFYLCHFLMDRAAALAGQPAPLHLIDLHRARQHRQVPRRWRIKDLAGLYFSSAPAAPRRTELLRFIRLYTGRQASSVLREQPRFWQAVQHEAERLYHRHWHTEPGFPLQPAPEPHA